MVHQATWSESVRNLSEIEQSSAELLIILQIFANVMSRCDLDLWFLDLELVQHFECLVFKLSLIEVLVPWHMRLTQNHIINGREQQLRPHDSCNPKSGLLLTACFSPQKNADLAYIYAYPQLHIIVFSAIPPTRLTPRTSAVFSFPRACRF